VNTPNELIAFLKSRHDEQVTSISQAFDWVKQRMNNVPYAMAAAYNQPERHSLRDGGELQSRSRFFGEH
jgi:hypothetical protein